MSNIQLLKDSYSAFTLPEKFSFFGCNAHEVLGSFKERDIYNFLRLVILDEEENSSIRRKAIELHTNYILLNKLKPRYALDILIESWPECQDVFLEIRRLKDLFLFYESEPDEIINIYRLGTTNNEMEIQSESYYNLGLIYFLTALKSGEVELRDSLQNSLSAFESANEIIENRTDAEFFKIVVAFILDLLENRKESSTYYLSRLTEILWRRDLLSISGLNSPFQISFYKILFSISKLDKLLHSTWLDYRENFSKLHYYYREIKNDELKTRLSESLLKEEFSKYCIASFFDPYLLVSPAYEIAKIDARLEEVNVDSDEYTFLNYLKEIESCSDLKKKIDIKEIQQKLSQLFPQRDLASVEPLLSSVTSISDTTILLQVFNILTEPSVDFFLDCCIYACIDLQSNKLYTRATEDERNTFVTNILTAKGWVVKDQTRRGKSHQGRSAGELDIFVTLQNGQPFAVIEALNLDSLKVDYLDLHLDKILGYDTAGLDQNLILVYASAKGFDSLWEKYYSHITKKIDYPHQLLQCTKRDLPFSEVRLAQTIHIRQNRETILFHLMINMNVLN